ncbi:MAG: hypothetical protein GY756_26095 [bacterium]|nr:hypothetical protein [bacterium]
MSTWSFIKKMMYNCGKFICNIYCHLKKNQISSIKKQAEDWMKDHKEINTELTNVQNGVTILLN